MGQPIQTELGLPMPPVQLIVDEVALLIINSNAKIEEQLRFVESRMEDTSEDDDDDEDPDEAPAKKRFAKIELVKEVRDLFVVKALTPVRVISTHQGFLRKVVEICKGLRLQYSIHDDRMPLPLPRLDLMGGFRGSQQRLTTQLLLAGISGCLKAPTRYGKCFGPDTVIRTWRGNIKARELVEGDIVALPDGGGARVLSTTHGTQAMIRVKRLDRPDRTWFCTDDHPLCISYRDQPELLMAAKDVMRLMDENPDFRANVRMRIADLGGKSEMAFTDTEVATWIADKRIPDEAMGMFTPEAAKARLEAIVRIAGDGLKAMARLKRFGRGVQELLWLALDTRTPAEDFMLQGKDAKILPPEAYPFTLDPAGVGPFVGWQIADPKQEFLLEDMTVVHNTTIIANVCRAFPGVPTVITLPGKDLVLQLGEEVQALLPERDIGIICSAVTGKKKRYSSDITVCSMDSLDHCDAGETRLLLVDEPHAAVTDPRSESIMRFEKARRYAIGATLGMRFDKRDPLIEGMFGPVHAQISFLEAVAEKSICQIEALILQIKIPPEPFYRDRRAAYDFFFFKSERMAEIHRWIVNELIPQDWQTLTFIKHEKQARLLHQKMGTERGIIAMAKLMKTKKVRSAVFADMRDGKTKRCLCSSIYSQGVTFPHIRVVVNMAGGGPYQSSVQKPGRLAQIQPGKRCGVLIDCMFIPDTQDPNVDIRKFFGNQSANALLCIDSIRRLETYKNTGYNINFVKTPAELKAVFQSKCL